MSSVSARSLTNVPVTGPVRGRDQAVHLTTTFVEGDVPTME
jgi:hypothetical protein